MNDVTVTAESGQSALLVLVFDLSNLTPICRERGTSWDLTHGGGGGGGGERKMIYLSLHFHHQNDSCIKMGSDESHFNVSLTVRDKVTRQCPQTTTFLKRKES